MTHQPKRPANDLLRMHVPFVFSGTASPWSVRTVGDQVLVEHIFGYHLRSGTLGGSDDYLSSVKVDGNNQTISVNRHHSIKRSDGSELSYQEACSSLVRSLSGSDHFALSKLVVDKKCSSESFEAKFSALPINASYLFTLPDFAIDDPNLAPLDNEHLRPTTGPFTLQALSPKKATLVRNRHFPVELTANDADKLEILSYPAQDSSEAIKGLDRSTDHAIYLYAHALTRNDLKVLEDKGFTVEIFPSEWAINIKTQSRVPFNQRQAVAEAIDGMREALIDIAPFAQSAFSVTPADRPFSLTKSDYRGAGALKSPALAKGDIGVATLKTMDEWAKIPLFKEIISRLLTKCPWLRFETFTRAEFAKASDETDFVLTPLGQSPGDPLSTLSFLAETNSAMAEVVRKEELVEIATTTDASKFNAKLQALHHRINSTRSLIPILHFPGVVAISKDFQRDTSLAYNWGIQAWTLRPR